MTGHAQGRDYLWLAVILALAAGLRIWGLNAPLWYDEILTVETHLRMGWSEMVQSYSMNHHYFHDLFAKASIDLLGEAPWTVRLPAMLAGLGAIAAMWVLARDVAGTGPAHVTALLLALSYHHIWFSQNARGYTGMALFGTIGLILFLRGLKAPKLSTWLWFALMLAATIFTHLTGAFFFATLGFVWLAVIGICAARGTLRPGMIRYPFLGFLIGGLLTILVYLPILPGVIETVSTVSDTSALDRMQEYQSPLWTVYEAIRTAVGSAGPIITLVALAVLVLSLAGAWTLRSRAPLFAPITFGHILLTMAILVALGMRVWPRFFFADIALLMLLIVLGVRAVCDLAARILGGRGRAWFFPLAVFAMVAVSVFLAQRNYAAPKQDLAGAFALAEAERRPGERIYAIAYAGNAFRDHFHADWPAIFTEDEYRAAMDQPGPLTIVVAFPDRSFRDIPGLAADRGTVLHETHRLRGTLGDGDVILLRRD